LRRPIFFFFIPAYFSLFCLSETDDAVLGPSQGEDDDVHATSKSPKRLEALFPVTAVVDPVLRPDPIERSGVGEVYGVFLEVGEALGFVPLIFHNQM
jgi:hypothetical protein